MEMRLLGNANCFVKLSRLQRLLKGDFPPLTPRRCKETDPVQSQLVLLKWRHRDVASRGLRMKRALAELTQWTPTAILHCILEPGREVLRERESVLTSDRSLAPLG